MEEDNSSTSDEEVTTPRTLEERVAYLEAQNEGLKRVGLLGLVLVLLLGAILVHQTYSELRSVATRGVTLLNEKDQLAVALTTDSQGKVVQFLKGQFGLLSPPNQPLPPDFQGFAFYDSQGQARLLLGENQNKETVFLVIDPVRGLGFDPFEGKAAARPPQTSPAASPTPGAPTGTPTAAPAPSGSPTP